MDEKTLHYGPKTDAYYERLRKVFLWPTGDESRPVLSFGKGARVTDIDGNLFSDYSSQVGVINTGQCPEKVISAVIEQMKYLTGVLTNDWQWRCQHENGYLAGQEVSPLRLAEELVRMAPIPCPQMVFPEVSGATSVDASGYIALASFLKELARDPERKKFAAFHGAFHGRHGLAKDISSSKSIHKLLHVQGYDVARLPFPVRGTPGLGIYHGYMDQVRAILDSEDYKDRIAALFVEVVQGEGGVNIADFKAMSMIYREAELRGIRFIVDEIQTGFGRTGKMFASDYLSFNPDAIILSKALGAGFPIGAVVTRTDILPNGFPHGAHSGTLGWAPVSVAAALANIQMIMEEKLVENARLMGGYLLERLKKVFWKNKFGRETVERIDGLGLMIGVHFYFGKFAEQVVRAAAAQKPGLILIGAGINTIRFMPPLTVTQAEIDADMEVLKRALDTLS
ncbi:aspartate aminotransferase family protein [Candidatus Giovannonibacteria bacterium]|nr:aspartate aminotransferase family protein [Candidatus Giovannonibacteria bacterium]